MCELFCISSKNQPVLNKYLEVFYSHSVTNSHGFGLMDNMAVYKEETKAIDSEYLKEFLRTPVRSGYFLSHIRYASEGAIAYDNTHPFEYIDNFGQKYVLIHNGTVVDCPLLDKYRDIQKGKTDSERVGLYLIECINIQQEKLGHPLTTKQKAEIVSFCMKNICSNNRSKVNIVLADGENMFIHCNFAKTLHYLKKLNSIIFSTKILTDENWQEVNLTSVITVCDGKIIGEEPAHGGVWIPITEQEKFWATL